MGVFDFIGNAGKKVFGGGRIDENAILKHLQTLGLNVQGLSVIAHQDKKMISVVGRVENLEDKEKLIIAAGNVDGVEKVDDRVRVVKAAPEPLPEPEPITEVGQAAEPTPEEAPTSTFYTVKSGDTLSGIAKEHYGNAGAGRSEQNLSRPGITHSFDRLSTITAAHRPGFYAGLLFVR